MWRGDLVGYGVVWCGVAVVVVVVVVVAVLVVCCVQIFQSGAFEVIV